MWASRLSRISVYFAINKLALSFSYSFHVPYTVLSNVYFYTVRYMFFLLFHGSQSEAGIVNQISHLSFHRKPTVGQLNVQTATAEKEKLIYLVSNKLLFFGLRSRECS